MKIMGTLNYDAWVLGNHEFNYGLDVLKRIIGDAQAEDIQVLSANTYLSNTSENQTPNFVKPYFIKSF
jgi:2',3'-cyclic-nucleotide 2'-phosphodiesterase/3'-nucleotidase